MTTATLRFAAALGVDYAISRIKQPELEAIFLERRGIEHFAKDIPIHDPEPVAREVIEIWDDSEDFDPNLWPYDEPVTPKKRTQNTWLPVMTDFGRNYA